VIAFDLRFVVGPLLSETELSAWLARRTQGPHWQDNIPFEAIAAMDGGHLGLLELCEGCEAVELWMETDPNSQLVLIWLLDYFRSHAGAINNLALCHVDISLGDTNPKDVEGRHFSVVPVGHEHLEIAGLAWRAYRSPTPQPWFDLLNKDLSILPHLRRCVLDMLEELPGRTTGLGASEMRLLELISAGYANPYALFPHLKQRFQRRVFDYWEIGAMLDGLALAPQPVVAGLAESPFTMEMHNSKIRHERYKQSRLSLTPLGKAILAGTEDFSRHNPIHRWWGGTELTNDRLWRWDPRLIAP
jgi:hypothetical protein